MQWKKAHFIGIGGVGMSATAKLLRDSGVEVSGSDEAVYPPISNFLTREHVSYATPYKATNVPMDADLVVIGKNAKLVAETNEEVAAAYASGKTILSFPEVLAELSKGKENIVVAGSYGKSTSAALLAHCLEASGNHPSYFIGASPLPPMTSAKIGSGNLFVLEGDEYPSSNTDPRSKFLLMHPTHVLLTPLAHDHVNAFPTPQQYMQPFAQLVSLLSGTLVACIESPMSRVFVDSLARPVVTYGVHEGDFHAYNILYGETTTFSLISDVLGAIPLETTQLGEHNVQNIVGVAAMLLTLKLSDPKQLTAAVKNFRGIQRRLDRKSERTLIPIFEGFGSSYEKLRSAIVAMKLHFPDRHLLVLFEPNTIGWRSRAALSHYDDVFADVTKVYIFNPPHDGKETQLSTDEIAERVIQSGIPAVAVKTPEQVLALFRNDLEASSSVLLSSSGAMGGLVESIPKLAEQKFPK